MNFIINKVILWFKSNPTPKIIEFKSNKINVITAGAKSAGNTSLFEIIDYCLLSDKVSIDLDYINSKIEWYGINISINNKNYTICRKPIFAGNGELSKSYFFSENGSIPQIPFDANYDQNRLKLIFNKEFNINNENSITYGENQKIILNRKKDSFRNYLLFNSISQNIITDQNVFFDFGRYKENNIKDVFSNSFDLILGKDEPLLALVKNKIDKLKIELENKYKILENYKNKIFDIAREAKSLGLLDNINNTSENLNNDLSNLFSSFSRNKLSSDIEEYEYLDRERIITNQKIKNLKKLIKSYEKGVSLLEDNLDSLKPIQFIKKNSNEILDLPLTKEFIKSLNKEFVKLKESLPKVSAIPIEFGNELKELETYLSSLEDKIQYHPIIKVDFNNATEKYINIGQIKQKFLDNESYLKYKKITKENFDKINLELVELNKLIEFKKFYIDEDLAILNDSIQKYIDLTSYLDEYKSYKINFDYNTKSLNYKKGNTSNSISPVSSSDLAFLHICLFLGLHKFFKGNNSENNPKVPQFIIIDELSRSFKEQAGSILRAKLQDLLSILNYFIEEMKSEKFQIILLEKIDKEIWEEIGLNNFTIVESFGDGLIPDNI